MGVESLRSQLEARAREKYGMEAEQLPFNHEDYAILRHADSGRWFAVFIVKPRAALGLPGDGDAGIVSLKIRDPLLTDMLSQQAGYLRGYPSIRWNWISIVLDGTVLFEEVCRWLDESYEATSSGTGNKRVALPKRGL